MIKRRQFITITAAALTVSQEKIISQAIAQENNKQNINLKDMSVGKENAPITMIEYASATCIHCANFHNQTWPKIKKNYVETGKVKFIFRESPFDNLALAAFMIARCAKEKQYFPIIDALFKQPQKWTKPDHNPKEELFKIAQNAGFSKEKFEACLVNENVARGIMESKENAQKNGVNATPTFFINGEKIEGAKPYAEFENIFNKIISDT